ncbi:uncharacterized protein LOC144136468 isoform X2 [Amblyomma americanum]
MTLHASRVTMPWNLVTRRLTTTLHQKVRRLRSPVQPCLHLDNRPSQLRCWPGPEDYVEQHGVMG